MGIRTGNPTWKDYPDQTTLITAAKLNAIETAIDNSPSVAHTHTASQVTDFNAAALAAAPAEVQATETVAGKAEVATQAETDAGTDDLRFVTPLKLATNIGAARGTVPINNQTGTTYTPVLTDRGKLVTLTNAAAITVTLPSDATVAFPIGTQIDFIGLGAGKPTFVAGSGATANGTPSLVARAQYSAETAIKVAANTWIVVGDLT
jgi:hypothetical protein